MDSLWLKAIVKALVLPPTGPVLIALAGLAIRRRFPRSGITLAWTGVLSLLLLSLPIVGELLLGLLQTPPPFDRAHAKEAQAVVILGGGIRHNAPEYGGDALGELTLERVRYGARIARQTNLPILVSGAPEASLMRAALELEFGVGVRWVEDRSLTTHENARYAAAMLKSAGIHRVVLVAHSFDMLRARAEFAAAGIETIPAAVELLNTEPTSLSDLVPSVSGLRASYFAIYEILGNLARVLGSRTTATPVGANR
jgi:uncharacterized SAM-binding protein YcdF (DUF218 family)